MFKMRWIIILVISIISNITVIAAKKSGHPHSSKRQQNQHSNISKLLDKLLENYVNVEFYVFFSVVNKKINFIIQDNSLRPDFGKAPAVVEIDLMVRSMGPVSEIEMVSFEVFFVTQVDHIPTSMFNTRKIALSQKGLISVNRKKSTCVR